MPKLLWSAFIVAFLLSGCSLLPEQVDKTAGWSAQKLYSEATDAMHGGNYERAIEYYQKLESRYPFGKYALQSQLNIAYAYYQSEEPDSALAAVDRFVKLHPDHPAVAYALYLKALVNFTRNMGFFSRFLPTDNSQRDPGSTQESYKDFAELVRRFPDTEYAQDAKLRMLYLRNQLARHEIHVARYYLDRGAWLAAANRAQYVVEHYQYTPSVKDGLTIMIIAYEKMGMVELYRDALRVLAINEKNGAFPKLEEGDKTLTEKIWEYLELDKG
ncbi:outer membrane protein assembly factor BamD [Thiolapillus sp.]